MASTPRTSRRRWSETFKKGVAAEASEPGVTIGQIAGRYDLDARRVSNWMKKFGSGVALMPVEVTSDNGRSPTSPAIEIDLPSGTRLRCDPGTNTELVTSVIFALRSKLPFVAIHQTNARQSGRNRQHHSLTILKSGCAGSSSKSLASQYWLAPSAMA